MIFNSDIISAAVVGTLYLLLFAGAEYWRHKGSPDVEHTRKLVHAGGGMIALGFPWFFRSHWTILTLAVIFALILIVTRRAGILRSVQGVERSTIGEIIYPAAVYLSFLLSSIHGGVAFYLAPLLVLAISDALAGVVGKRIRSPLYDFGGETKSLAGSTAFFIPTLLIMAVALNGGISPEMLAGGAIIIALTAAAGLTIVEALSPRGLDNITLPMAAWYFLYLVDIRRDDPAIMIAFYAAVWIPFLIGLRAVLKSGRSKSATHQETAPLHGARRPAE